MTQEIHIESYFSLPTDLAGEMRSWPEFVSGAEYSVELRDATTGEQVTVKLIKDGDEQPYVSVSSVKSGILFDRVLGRVISALSRQSDNLMVDRMK
jgi:hypothetical protein